MPVLPSARHPNDRPKQKREERIGEERNKRRRERNDHVWLERKISNNVCHQKINKISIAIMIHFCFAFTFESLLVQYLLMKRSEKRIA